MSIPPSLYRRLFSALLKSDAFATDAALQSRFVDARISHWAADLPEAASDGERVRATIEYLQDQRDTKGNNALSLLLQVLCEQTSSTDARHQELAALTNELNPALEIHPQQVKAPETTAQKFLHFFTGDTEAQRAYRNRQAMLQLVRNTWIKGVLEQSLHGAAMLELGKEYSPDAVERPWDMELHLPDQEQRLIPHGTPILDIFDECSGAMLILGEPGSGKTTTLLKLGRALIERAEQDTTAHIPVVFNLSSWAVKQQKLEEWLLEELRTKYRIPKKVGQDWLNNDALLLLLDGLDEVKVDARDKCIVAINAFREEHFIPLVVCSRSADYERLTAKLHLDGAICLRPLTTEQIDAYLAGTGTELQAVHATLKHDSVLQEMAESPLMLSIMVLAYSGLAAADLQNLATSESRRQHLFGTYVERMFQRRNRNFPYSLSKTYHWLAWLAYQMTIHNQTLLLMENIHSNWLSDRESKLIRLLSGIVDSRMWLGIVRVESPPTKKITWSWRQARKTIFIWILGGSILGLVGGLMRDDSSKAILWKLFALLPEGIMGILLGVLLGLVFGGLVGALFEGIVIRIGEGMILNRYEGKSYNLHVILLNFLAFTNRAPWNYARFLDHCTDRILLRKVGGGYIFIHRSLQEYFASLTPEDIERLSKGK